VIVSDDGRMAYLADSAPGDVYSVSLPNLRVAWKQHVGGAPFGLLLHAGRLFVSLFSGASVVELDPKTGNTMGMHQVPQGPAALATDPSGRVVVAGTRGKLTTIDGGEVAAGNGFGVALAGGRLWTADYERAELVPAGDDHRVGLPLPIFPFWLATGAGELLAALPDPFPVLELLVLPSTSQLSTADVYREADQLGLARERGELRIRAAFQFGQGIGCRATLFVRPIARDGVVRIGNGHDSRAQRNILANQGVWVAGPIEKFMVVQDHLPNPRQRRQRLQDFRAEDHVRFHQVPFFGIQWP